ncbi:hypothetical protein ACU18_01260 [Arthrobacter sp. ZBG10]|uniref:hypothetical protein n=1 Tax=Micrococcaceae TaxID=1268 RepID=UPI0006826A43|nr:MULTISPECIES: hypothetical protein [Micrococcaceae]KNH22521.1 hypothetical protein ACU18_01260 [Arthrobacter sp. ZBG10]KQQ92289.1 hypothetical protein ASF72_03625 [Arthrobacter sp. Leaf141]
MAQDNQHAEPEKDPGGYGTPTAEQETAGSAQHQGDAATNESQADGDTPVARDMDLPSAAAEIDETNDDSKGSAPVSSEPGQEAAGVPDGSGNDLPQEKSPKDDDGEDFAAG